MAAKESSQGAALGPDISGPRRPRPAERDPPSLDDVLGQFMEALCIVQVVSCALTAASAEASAQVGFCAVALRQGCEMLDAAYGHFDRALVRDSGGSASDLDDGLDADDASDGPTRRRPKDVRGRGSSRNRKRSKRSALTT